MRRTLLTLAGEVQEALGPDRDFSRRWRALGVTMEVTDLPASGAAFVSRSKPVALIGKKDDHLRRRYTMAHEFAHLLLARAARMAGWKPERKVEETLCEDFASEVLIGRRRLATYLSTHGCPRDPHDLLALCSAFQVNLRPMFHALRAPLAEEATIFIAARLRGHENRPHEVEFRVEAAVGHHAVFVPRQQRLASLGFEELTQCAWRLERRESGFGSDWPRLSPRRIANPISVAETPWQALMVGGNERLLLVSVDVGDVVQAPLVPAALAA